MSKDWPKPAGDNAAQVDFWNGRVGENWARNQERFDRAFASLTPGLIEATKPGSGERILDIGCGCGDLSLALAERIGPRGHVLGVDISKPMLERARVRAHELAGDHASLDWLEADASTHEFSAEFDLLASRFGVMFFADPIAGFRNLRSALKPGGRFAFLCWRGFEHNSWVSVPFAQIADLVPPPPAADPFTPGPFALSDSARVLDILREAGFEACAASPVEGSVLLGRAEAAEGVDLRVSAAVDALELALRTGPLGALLREAGDELRDEARRRVSARMEAIASDSGEVRLRGSCWLYTGRR